MVTWIAFLVLYATPVSATFPDSGMTKSIGMEYDVRVNTPASAQLQFETEADCIAARDALTKQAGVQSVSCVKSWK